MKTIMTKEDCRTRVERLAEIDHRIATGLYRQGSLTELVNIKHQLEREIRHEQKGGQFTTTK